MPFLNEDVIIHMLKHLGDSDIVIPKIHGWLEPLHAFYSKTCLPHIEGLLAEDDLKILNFLHKAKVVEIGEEELVCFDPGLRFIMNLNTPEDLENARRIVADSLDR